MSEDHLRTPNTIALVVVTGLMLSAATQTALSQTPGAPVPSDSPLMQRLLGLVLHTVNAPPSEIVATIREGLDSAAAVERELALATLTSRIGAPWFDGKTVSSEEARAAWVAEVAAVGMLQSRLEELLADPDAHIRGRVVQNLVAIHLDPATYKPAPDARTERLLIEQFHKDPSDSICARIIGLFDEFPSPLSSQASALLHSALSDPRSGVRWSAVKASVEHMTEPEAASLLMRQLADQDQQVRVQVALQLLRFQQALAPHLSALRAAVAKEEDAEVRSWLEKAIEQAQQQ
jgi:HEAT repeat protein